VTVQELTPELSRIFMAEGDGGVLVVSVKDQSPGDWAGILSGDVITKFGANDIGNGGDFDTAVTIASPGLSYSVELIRGGQPLTVVVTVSEKYSAFSPESTDIMAAGTDLLDLFVVDMPEDIATEAGITGGVLVLDVSGDVSMIEPGDLILSVNRRPVNDRVSYLAALAGVAQDESALLLIHRHTKTFFVTREIRN
jgi:serine protease Do